MKNPKLISKPFAQNGQKNVIPEKYETSMESNQATWDQGFGQITMLPVSAGGLPPKGQDFNGILNQMCETIVHISKGGVFKFSVDYATAINGYPKGAILQSEDEKKYYQSLIDNNKVNFNTASQDQIKTSWKLVMTDDLLDQLSKKLESSAVVQSTGSSTTSVMSQKASTDSFQPKGNYADKSLTATQTFLGPIESINSVWAKNSTNNRVGLVAEGNRRFISTRAEDGSAYNSIVIPDKNGTMALSNDLYDKIECDTRFQPKGNYLVSGYSYSKSESDAKYQAKGNYQVEGYSYSKSESENKFQPKGNYADKSLTATQTFLGPIESINSVWAKNSTNNRVGLVAEGNRRFISTRAEDGSAYNSIVIPDKNGTMALISDIDEANNIPVGSPTPWSLPTAPSGYLICQGQTFNKATYPKLAIAYPSGRLPDLRGDVIRGLDAGRGVDAGRQILSEQMGNSLLSTAIMNDPELKGFELKIRDIGTSGTDNQGRHSLYQQIEGMNGNETRMRNISFLYIVRAA